jgi:hypothetical protein
MENETKRLTQQPLPKNTNTKYVTKTQNNLELIELTEKLCAQKIA